MTVSPVSSYSDPYPATTNTGTKAMDPSKFFELLMAQLTHQNPMEPMNDSEMMGQMVQLNTLQELQTIKTAMQEMVSASQTSYAASLVGKTVQAEVKGEKTSGKVTGVTLDGSNIQVHIGEKSVPLSAIVGIEEEETNG